MRNLVCEDHAVRELPPLGRDGGEEEQGGREAPATTTGTRVDAFCCADDRLYLATSSAGVYCVDPDAGDGGSIEWSVQLLPPASSCGGGPAAAPTVAALSAQPELGGLFLGLAEGGELLILRPGEAAAGPGAHHNDVDVEEIGALAGGEGAGGGLAAAAWSPDGALLAAATRAGRLLLLTGAPEWEVLAEVDIPRPPPEEEEEGKDGEGARDPPPPPLLDVEITWRGDGRFFATASAPRGDSGGDSGGGGGIDGDSSGGSSAPCRARRKKERRTTTVHIWAREEEDPEPGGCTARGAGGHPSAFGGGGRGGGASPDHQQPRHCVLHATAEAAPGLTGAVAWQPNCRHLFAAQVVPAGHDVDAVVPAKGKLAAVPAPQRVAPAAAAAAAATAPGRRQALIASAPRTGDEEPGPRDQPWLRVALFERNGLKHGGFEVVPPRGANNGRPSPPPSSPSPSPSPSHRVCSLAWSPDSELLAAVLEPAEEDEEEEGGTPSGSRRQPWAVQVWHRSNWHWYLKHELRLGGGGGGGDGGRGGGVGGQQRGGGGSGSIVGARVLALWDDAAAPGAAGALHVVSSGLGGPVRHDRMRFAWAPCVSPLGTALVVDGRDVLVTPARLALAPPPMCAARLRCCAPVCALAVTGPALEDPDDDADEEENGDGDDDDGDAAQQRRRVWGGGDSSPDSPSSSCPLAERVAAVLAGGRLAVAAAVEDDLWEETLEEAEAAAAAAVGSGSAAAAAAPLPGRDRFGAPLLLAAEAVGEPSSACAAGGAPATPPPLAGGRPVRLAAWVSATRLLLVAAPTLLMDSGAGAGKGAGKGDVLVEVELFCSAAAAVDEEGEQSAGRRRRQRLAWRELGACRAGAAVLAAASVPGGGGGGAGGGALVQLAGGRLARYLPCSSRAGGGGGGRLLPLGAAHGFPAPCPVMIPLPRPRVSPSSFSSSSSSSAAGHPWAVGLDPSSGRLFLGPHALASDATSVAVRSDGAGGAALLWTCRGDVLRVALLPVLLRRLQAGAGAGALSAPASSPAPFAAHSRPQPAPPPVSRRGDEHILRGELRQAVAAAMRPTAASRAVAATLLPSSSQPGGGGGGGGDGGGPSANQQQQQQPLNGPMPVSAPAAAGETLDARPVEQGARLVCAPCGGGCRAVLQMPRGNLEAVAPRLLALVAAARAVRAGRWREAWALVGEHRLDPNLLADVCGGGDGSGDGDGYGDSGLAAAAGSSSMLVAGADAFVAAAPSSAELCDFVHALRPGSTLRDADADGTPGAGGVNDGGDGDSGDGARGAGARSSGAARAAAATRAEAEATPVAGLYAALPETAGMPDLAGPRPLPGTPEANKVTLVCTAIREAVLRRAAAAAESAAAGEAAAASPTSADAATTTTTTTTRLRAGDLRVVVATYARSDPPDLESALLVIKDAKEAALRQEEEEGQALLLRQRRPQQQRGEDGDAAAEAIRHLLLHVDSPDRLYEAALGLYDLPLAFAVASEAQRDPGAALEELRALGRERDPCLRRAAVDARLGRHERAAANLLAAGPAHFDRALSLAKDHGFLRRFVAMVRAQRVQGQEEEEQDGGGGSGGGGGQDRPRRPSADAKRSQLAEALAAYGEHLLASGRAEDAALAFAAASRPARALDAYRAAGAWRAALALAAAPALAWPRDRVRALAAELADELAASGQVAAAAEVALEALGDVDRAAQLFSEAGEWRRALQACYCGGMGMVVGEGGGGGGARADLVETVVAPRAAAAASALLEEAREAEQRVRKYAARLTEVRGRREAVGAALARLAADGGFGAPGGGEDDAGGASEAPSIISGFSAYTDASTAAFGAGGWESSSSSASGASFAPSTLGGRPAGAGKAAKKAARDARKASRRGAQGRIKQGGFLEEVSLAALVLSLAPRPHALAAAGALAEALVLLGHAGDAARLQRAVAAWQRAAAEARAAVAARPPPEDEMRQAEPEVRRAVERAVTGEEEEEEGGVGGGGAAGGAAARMRTQQKQAVAWKWDLLRD